MHAHNFEDICGSSAWFNEFCIICLFFASQKSARKSVEKLIKLLLLNWCQFFDNINIDDFLLHNFKMSVCPTHAGILSKWLNIKLFTPLDSHITLVFTYEMVWQYFDGDPLTGGIKCRGSEKQQFSASSSLYLGNDTKYSRSYNGILTQCHALLRCVISNDLEYNLQNWDA